VPKRGEQPDKSLGRFIERSVIRDRHRAGHVEIAGHAAPQPLGRRGGILATALQQALF
jgi:hypothetical protein